jgi:hypothetical protein
LQDIVEHLPFVPRDDPVAIAWEPSSKQRKDMRVAATMTQGWTARSYQTIPLHDAAGKDNYQDPQKGPHGKQ